MMDANYEARRSMKAAALALTSKTEVGNHDSNVR